MRQAPWLLGQQPRYRAPAEIIRDRIAKEIQGAPSSSLSDLLDRRDLDQQALAARAVELHLGDPLRALAGDRHDAAVTEVGVPDAVPRGEREVAVVAHLAGDLVGPLGLRLQRGSIRGNAV